MPRDPELRVYVQKIEKANSSQELADASEGMRNTQNPIRGNRHVVRADQLAQPRRIEIRDSRQVQQDSSLPAAEERPDAMPQLRADGHPQPTLYLKHRRVIALDQ